MMPQQHGHVGLPSSMNINGSSSSTFVHLQEPAPLHPNPNPNPTVPPPSPNPNPVKRKRNLPGNPDPDAEVIALSPKSLMATNRFICEICNKGFQREQNLQLHRRGHNLPWKLKQRTNKDEVVKKKVYICPEKSCVHHDASRALGDLTGIKKHFSRKHGEKKWKCDKCSKKYAVMSDWKAHSKICGTREYRCDCGTIFSRKDSFITHRAFCDALAEESARVVPTTPLNFKTDFNNILTRGATSSSGLMNAHHQAVNLMPQFTSSSTFRSNLSPAAGIDDFHVNNMKPTRLPVWLDQQQQHIMTSNSGNVMDNMINSTHDTRHSENQEMMMMMMSGAASGGGAGGGGGGFLASSSLAAGGGGNSCLPDHEFMTQMGPSSNSCLFGTNNTMQFQPRVNLKQESDHYQQNKAISAGTTAGGYNMTTGNNSPTDFCNAPPHQSLQASYSLSSPHNHHLQQQSNAAGNMSATALLQKAAHIGSTRSHSSIFANSLGVMTTGSSTFSNLANFNSNDHRHPPPRRQQQAQDDEDFNALMNSMPSSSSSADVGINGTTDHRGLLLSGDHDHRFPSASPTAVQQLIMMSMGNINNTTHDTNNTAGGVKQGDDHHDGKMSTGTYDCSNVIHGDHGDGGFDSATRDFLGLGGGGGGNSGRGGAASSGGAGGKGTVPQLIFQQDQHQQLPRFANSMELTTHHFNRSK